MSSLCASSIVSASSSSSARPASHRGGLFRSSSSSRFCRQLRSSCLASSSSSRQHPFSVVFGGSPSFTVRRSLNHSSGGSSRYHFLSLSCAASAMMSSESESTAANSNNDEQQQIKMTRMAEWLKNADAVCFDVDSTVINTEGIDELADYFGAGEAVAKLTKEAMEGGMKFEEALDARLKLINPTQQGVDKFMAMHAFPIMPGMRELVVKLLTSGKQVFLVSGGFRQMIAPVANEIGVPVNKIYANNIMFDEEGKYAGFDDTEPTSRSGGKAEAVKRIKASNGFQTVVMVGDGMTDLEARVEGGADAFICFTGVVRRDAVAEGADLAVGEMAQIMDLLL